MKLQELIVNSTLTVAQCVMHSCIHSYLFLAPDFEEVDANAFNAMVGNVDLESDNQAGLAQEVLEAMLLGAPTTTPDIPTRTRDPDLTQGNLKKWYFVTKIVLTYCEKKLF